MVMEHSLTCRVALEVLGSGPNSGWLLVRAVQTRDSHSWVVCMAFAAGLTTI